MAQSILPLPALGTDVEPKNGPKFSVEHKGGVVEMAGVFEMTEAESIWERLSEVVGKSHGKAVVDLSRVTRIDSGIMALLVSARAGFPGKHSDQDQTIELRGARDAVKEIQDMAGGNEKPFPVKKPKPEGTIEQIGRVTSSIAGEFRQVITFVGHTVHGIAQAIRKPKTTHFGAVPYLVQKAGADAVPIVLLLNFLLGFVMGYQAARQLEKYGANLYVADLVGISVTRELAPLMTAIIVAGRSGAAFAAELGTMKVSEEFDALRTLGFGPIRYLVLPRVLTLLIAVPVLTVLGDVIGCMGGLFVAWSSLGISPTGYLRELSLSVHPMDVITGLIKSGAYAWAISIIACQQGFATSGGAEGVGKRTTSTVVGCLFALIFIDSVATVVFRSLGW